MSPGAIAFRIGRAVGKHPLAGQAFCTIERLLPLNRLARANNLVAFHHPRPIAEPHILIVPTHPVESLTTNQFDTEHMADLIWKMIELGREIAPVLPESDAWLLVINGGKRQDFGQLHAHLLHASSSESTGISIAKPTQNPGPWQRLFTQIERADRVADNGYSLEIRWSADNQATAEVTQSKQA